MKISALLAILLIQGTALGALSFYEASGISPVVALKPAPSIIRNDISGHPLHRSLAITPALNGGMIITLPSRRSGQSDIAIFDLTGKVAFRNHGFNGEVLSIERGRFTPGFYSVTVLSDGIRFSRRVIITH